MSSIFADDTGLVHAHTDVDSLIDEINEELPKNNNLVPYQQTFSKYKKKSNFIIYFQI